VVSLSSRTPRTRAISRSDANSSAQSQKSTALGASATHFTSTIRFEHEQPIAPLRVQNTRSHQLQYTILRWFWSTAY
jgi:hypothetical protein